MSKTVAAEPDDVCFLCGAKAYLVDHTDGCKYCGGMDCGDWADALAYCETCAEEAGIKLPEVSPS